jgi:tetratricopeptide (TPR) repeat protein
MRRASAARDEEGNDDLGAAHLNLQRALALDDRHMPTHNQLALLYLQVASGRAPDSHLRIASDAPHAVDAEHKAKLELAALVCQQAMGKDPAYAPIYNTAGLVHVALGDLSAAVRAFDKARELDPRSFEAHMNFAAVNLQFRGFGPAAGAYDKALALSPKSYDAHLGLALALRGQIGGGADDAKLLARSAALLDNARKLDDRRPEAYFNKGILVLEFQARRADLATSLKEARALFTEFMGRANGRAEFALAVKEAEGRVRDIDEMMSFQNDGGA